VPVSVSSLGHRGGPGLIDRAEERDLGDGRHKLY
jgi:hypothetical protein